MAQPLSIERDDWTYLITTRTAESRLWFIQNPKLERRILGSMARYQEIHCVEIFAFVLMGNHYHLVARFPRRNRALFMRDFNSAVARLTGRYVKTHGRRSVWARRYAYQILPTAQDVKHWFFYTALNPISSGIVPRIHEYSGYNSFHDAAFGIDQRYAWLDWNAYFKAKRHGRAVSEAEFTKHYMLRFSRLPGFEDLSQQEYQTHLENELLFRAKQLREEREHTRKGFLGREKLLRQTVGSIPRHSKQSGRFSFRPIVLSLSREAKKLTLEIYFSILSEFKEASRQFLDFFPGNMAFPTGTYPPPRIQCLS